MSFIEDFKPGALLQQKSCTRRNNWKWWAVDSDEDVFTFRGDVCLLVSVGGLDTSVGSILKLEGLVDGALVQSWASQDVWERWWEVVQQPAGCDTTESSTGAGAQ